MLFPRRNAAHTCLIDSIGSFLLDGGCFKRAVMSETTSSCEKGQDPADAASSEGSESSNAAAIVRRTIQVLLTLAIWLGLFFGAAGTWRWPPVWYYAGLSLGLYVLNLSVLMIINPDVTAARVEHSPKARARETAEILAGAGPDPQRDTRVRAFGYQSGEVTILYALRAFQPSMTHGVNVAGGIF